MKMFTYIENYSEEAKHQMAIYKIPASVIMAQAIFESSCGTSALAKRSNNHFGIKCHSGWMGDTTTKTDDTLNECFRKYNNVRESYTDHSVFLVSRPRYAQLFSIPVDDYRSWCKGLKAAGYATYPTYAEELIRIIEQNKLHQLDGPENLPSGIFLSKKQSAVKTSRLKTYGFNLRDFGPHGLLWLDERDICIQSMGLILEDDELDELAGN